MDILFNRFPCRQHQINTLHQILDEVPLPATLFIYGQPAVGKTSITTEYLQLTKKKYAYINGVECYTNQLFFTSIISQLLELGTKARCDNLMDLVHQLKLSDSQQILGAEPIIIILDGIEYIQELNENYLSAFCYLQQLTSIFSLCVIFITHILPEKFNIDGSYIKVYFPQYKKDELLQVLKTTKPENFDTASTDKFYENYLICALNTFLRTTRDLNEMKFLVVTNFRKYCQPIDEGTAKLDDVSFLWRNILPYFKASLDSVYSGMIAQGLERVQYDPESNELVATTSQTSVLDLPYYAKYFLIAAYLASYNSPKYDRRLFLKNHGKKRKRLTQKQIKEKLSLELVGPKPFPLDRLFAIFYSIMEEKANLTVNLVTQISTLVELRLLAKLGEANLEKPQFKCLIGFQTVDAVAKTLGFNVKKYLLE